MKLKNLKLIFAAVAGVAVCSTLGGNVHAAEFNKNRIGYTNYKDEVTYHGRVYSEYESSADRDKDKHGNYVIHIRNDYTNYSLSNSNKQVTSKYHIYKSGKYWIGHQEIINDETHKKCADKWYDVGSNPWSFDKVMNAQVQKIFKDAVELGGSGGYEPEKPHTYIADWGNVSGWRKLGRTWFFINQGVITKTKTTAKTPNTNRITYGFGLSGSKEEYNDFGGATKPYKNNQIVDEKYDFGVVRKYSAIHDKFFGTLPGHKWNNILFDQFTGKVVYNKWHAFYQSKFIEKGPFNYKVIVKKFYIKADKHGHVAKGTYKGMFYKWTFGDNGVLKRQQKI